MKFCSNGRYLKNCKVKSKQDPIKIKFCSIGRYFKKWDFKIQKQSEFNIFPTWTGDKKMLIIVFKDQNALAREKVKMTSLPPGK